jgi:hypothetical protein
LKDDEEFLQDIVKINGSALEFASKRLQNNYNIVFESVKNDPYAF